MPPSPSPVHVVIVGDVWSWSLDSVIAVLGALATVLLAWFALAQTRRANHLEVEARERDERARADERERAARDRERAQRAEAFEAISVYVNAWIPAAENKTNGAEETDALMSAAAGISPEAVDVAAWVTQALYDLDRAVFEHQGRRLSDINDPPSEARLLRGPMRTLRYRLINWVANGALDRSPIPTSFEPRQ